MSNVALPAGSRCESSTQDTISLPLYICGLIVTWCGIFAVNAVLANDAFTSTTLMLSGCGFAFSMVCRRLRVDPRLINYMLPVAVGAYFAIRVAGHSVNILYFIPTEAVQNDNFVAVLLVWFSVVRSWMLVTDGAIVFTSVTSIAMIGLVGAFNVNANQIVWFTLYVMGTLYMLMHQNYLAHRGWTDGADDHRRSTISQTHAILCVLIGIVALIVSTLLVVPIKMLGSDLSPTQAMRQFFSPASITDAARFNGMDFSDSDTFPVGTGEGFNSDDVVVMMARPSDGQEHYWIGRTYDHYQRHTWTSTLAQRIPIEPSVLRAGDSRDVYRLKQFPEVAGITKQLPPPAKHILETKFEIMFGRTATMYAPAGVYALLLKPIAGSAISQCADGYVGYDSLQQRFHFNTYSDDRTPSSSQLVKTGSEGIPVFIRKHYLDDRGEAVLSVAERERLADTATAIVSRLPRSHMSSYYRAQAIRDWVASRCAYSLKVDPVPPDQDAVSYFLFTSRKGYCDLFASSMAMLCRYAGIPSRVVTGFAPGTRNQKDVFDVRARDKHAWVEVYFPNIGWWDFDPTANAIPDSVKPQALSSVSYLKNIYTYLWMFLNLNGPIPIFLFVVIVLCLSYVIKIEVVDRIREEMRLRNTQSFLEASEASAQSDGRQIEIGRRLALMRYARMMRAMSTMGMPLRGQRSPAAYAQVLRQSLRDRYQGQSSADIADVLEAVDGLTEDATIASYAPDSIAVRLATSTSDRRARNMLVNLDSGAKAHWWRTVIGIRLSARNRKIPAA